MLATLSSVKSLWFGQGFSGAPNRGNSVPMYPIEIVTIYGWVFFGAPIAI